MLVSELLLERRLQRTRIMYHGTTSLRLPSIMKHGLIPNAPRQGFGSTSGLAYRSMGGVYLSSRMDVADAAASEVADEYGGDPIIITVNYVITSGGPDEDAISQHFIALGLQYIEWHSDEYEDIDDLKDMFIYTCTEDALDYMASETANVTNRTRKLINEFFNIIFNYAVNNYDYEQMMEVDVIYNKINEIIDSAKDTSDAITVRVLRPIKFKGKTRIIQITNLRTNEIYYQEKKPEVQVPYDQEYNDWDMYN